MCLKISGLVIYWSTQVDDVTVFMDYGWLAEQTNMYYLIHLLTCGTSQYVLFDYMTFWILSKYKRHEIISLLMMLPAPLPNLWLRTSFNFTLLLFRLLPWAWYTDTNFLVLILPLVLVILLLCSQVQSQRWGVWS